MQIVEIVGAIAILAAYIANLLGRIEPSSLSYALLNLFGSAILTVIAIFTDQWGFLLLQGVWTLLSLFATVQILRGVPGSSCPQRRTGGRDGSG